MSNMHQEMLRKRLLYLKLQDLFYTCLDGEEERQEKE